MIESNVIIARIYLHESSGQMQELLEYLHDESRVKGVTVFRGITGFGSSGKYHSSTLLDMSLDLPVIIEFFDVPEKMAPVLEFLGRKIKPGRMVSWHANVNLDS